jgi:hypothetical protein
MLKIDRISGSEGTRVRLSGDLRSAELNELRTEIERIMPLIILDLAEVRLVDFDAVRWLAACETAGFKVANATPYIREWMCQEKT